MMKKYSNFLHGLAGSIDSSHRWNRGSRRIALVALALGIMLSSSSPAKADSFASSLVPYADTLWLIFYILLGLFVIIGIWEIAMTIYIRRAEALEMESGNQELGEKSDASASESPSGLMEGDSVDPFQALLSKAGEEEKHEAYHSSGNVDKVEEVPRRGGSVAAASKPEFDGTATLPVGAMANRAPSAPVASKSPVTPPKPPATPGHDDDANPFRRLAKIGAEEEGNLRSATPRFGSARPGASANAVIPGSSSPVPVANRPSPSSSSSSFSGSATISVGTSSAGKSMVMPGAGTPVGAPKAAKAPIATPAPKPMSAGKPAGGAGGADTDDPWKKLLGQTSGRSVSPVGISKPASSAPAGASGAMSAGGPARSGGIKLGSGVASSRTPEAAAPKAASGDDPWQSLLGTSPASGSDSKPQVSSPLAVTMAEDSGSGSWPAASSAPTRGISLDIKRGVRSGQFQDN